MKLRGKVKRPEWWGKVERACRRVCARSWGWIHFKFALGIVWPILTLITIPRGVEVSLGTVLIYAWLGLTMVGAVMSISGIFMQAQPGRISVIGVSVELVGLIFMFTGPFLFGVVYLWLATQGDEVRLTAIGLAYALCAGMIARGIEVVPRFLREAHDPTKEV